MPNTLTLISVRLDPPTLRLLDQLAQEAADRRRHPARRSTATGPNRSATLRHALRTGLDLLTHQPPLKL